jgi:hypothetical protein
MKKIKRGFILSFLLTFILIISTTSCGFLGDSPEKGAREFAEAVLSFDIDRAKVRLCNELSSEVSKGEAQLKQAKSLMELSGGSFKADLSQVNFTSEIEGNTAQVTASGKVKLELKDKDGKTEIQEQEIPSNFKFKMVQEDGTWKFCEKFPAAF